MKGIVLENKKNYSTVLTSDGRFLNVRRSKTADIGDELSFDEISIMTSNIISIKRNIIRVCSIAAMFLLVSMSAFSVYQYNDYNRAVYAYVSLDINPSFEMAINKRQRVLSVQPLNTDAENLLTGLKLKDAPIQDAVKLITEKSAEQGYLNDKKDNYVIMAASASEKSTLTAEEASKLSAILEQAGSDVFAEKGMKGLVEVIRANPELRNGAQEKGLSLGKYVVYSKAIKEGLDINIEDLRSQGMSNTLKKAGGDIKEIISQSNLEYENGNMNDEKNKEDKKEDKKQDDKIKDDNKTQQDSKQDNKNPDDKKPEQLDKKQEDLKNDKNEDKKQDVMKETGKKDNDKKEAGNNELVRNEIKKDSKDEDKKDTKADVKAEDKKDKQNDKR